MSNPLVSIVIPVYNGQKYIEQCIRSILSQDYDRLQLVVVNDGSKDGTEDIVLKIMREEERIVLINQENGGPSKARNSGLEYCEGKYVMFFDADDLMDLNAIRIMVELAESQQAELVLGNYCRLLENKSIFVKQVKKTEFVESKGLFSKCVKKHPGPCNKLYCRDIINKHQLTFIDSKIGEDLNFYFKYLVHIDKVYFTNKVVFYYRIVENSLSNQSEKNVLNIFQIFDDLRNYYQEQNVGLKYIRYISYVELIHVFYHMLRIKQNTNKEFKRSIRKY